MNSLKSYFAPGKKEKKENVSAQKTLSEKKASAPTEMLGGVGSPGFTPVNRTAFSSRPASLYPEGDFRNAERQSVLDIKSDVMVNWLHQNQLERLYAFGLPGEGVVLKKAKGNYCAAPEQLLQEQGGFCEMVAQMNVKVHESIFGRDWICN